VYFKDFEVENSMLELEQDMYLSIAKLELKVLMTLIVVFGYINKFII
jgi:hypothetical protein